MNQFDRKKIIALLQQRRVQSYSFSIVFFIIFTFFVVFAIRPNIITAFSLQKELQELRLKDKLYEQQIIRIVNYQSLLEGYRDDLSLLEEALPPSPALGKAIEAVEQVALASNLTISNIEVQRVALREQKTSGKVKSFRIIVNADTTFSSAQRFLDEILNQRRLKTIEQVELSRQQFTNTGVGGINNYRIDITVVNEYL